MSNNKKSTTIDTMKASILSAVITGFFGIVATIAGVIISANIAKEKGEQETISEVNSQIANIAGDNNTVTINNVDDLITRYDELTSENKLLFTQSTEYYNELEETKKELKSLKNQSGLEIQELEQQINKVPDIQYENAGLMIDGINMSVNTNNYVIDLVYYP